MTALGKYVNTNSILHQLDPRIKLISMFLLVIVALVPSDLVTYSIFLIIVLIGFYLSKVFISSIKSILKSLLFMMIFLLVFNLFLMKNGNIIVEFGWLKIYDSAIYQSIFIFLRLFILLGLSTLLTITTKPMDLTLAIEKLLNPLTRFNFPSHEIAMIISIALRFIPVFASETEKIIKAQTSRGIDFEKGSFQEKMRGILSLIIPLFVSAFQKANDLANALEARGYGVDKPKTKYRILKYTRKDYIFFVVVICISLVIIGLSYAL